MRAVVDANVFLSALLGGVGTRPVLLAVLDRRFDLVLSETLLDELAFVLKRPEWLRRVGRARCRELLTTVREAATLVTPTQRITACRDHKDNAVLECAVAGADCIVTGDHDLLVLHPFRGIAILRPAEFLQRLS